VQLSLPDAAVPPREQARLSEPQAQPPAAPRSSGTEERDLTPPPPTGIPQYSVVKTRVAAGLKPSSIDGLDWLKNNGYRTVLNLRQPGADDSSDRQQFDKRGLRYLSLEVSPQTLTKEIVDQFNQIVGDAGNQPLFVYDQDGVDAGGLWYLHFRIVDGATNQQALARAASLGLKEDGNDRQRDMWAAVQSYLSKNPR